MKVLQPLYLLLLLLVVVAMVTSALKPDFLNLRRKYRRHHCPHKRCLPLHSRVPFP
ncbi:apelin receptor early endogenous ligand [Astyanax mexicanus]|uniref:Apelin receptor early endogenous ligand n=2 Tax=Astyanax mexicanus TaxID=7994 RepID=A0A8T2KL98_ASTMX|nr:apelin receptor early endogenous ligand [Astyanax mexicanus]KAG9260064.1 apelin receptor early endogenous ligand [Astyanax mexicanus]